MLPPRRLSHNLRSAEGLWRCSEIFHDSGSCTSSLSHKATPVAAYRPIPRVQRVVGSLPTHDKDLFALALMREAVSRMHARQRVAQGRAGGILRGRSEHALGGVRDSILRFGGVAASAAQRGPRDGLGRRAAAWLGILGGLLRVGFLVAGCSWCRLAVFGVEGPQSRPVLVPLHLRLHCAQQVSRLPEGLHYCLPGQDLMSSDPEIQKTFVWCWSRMGCQD